MILDLINRFLCATENIGDLDAGHAQKEAEVCFAGDTTSADDCDFHFLLLSG
jgi:hypothetical protein